ncbi:hypothetical protein AAC387_Pa07g2548 [Persea americana]
MEEQSFGSCSCLLVLQKKRWKWQKESVGRGREDEDEKDAWDLFFDLERLELATDHFSEENLLGRGGFGPVYKGKIQGGHEIAVKKLSMNSRQGLREFTNEVKFLYRIQHRNLVVLLGCCVQRGEKALVYEYLPNKSLDNFLFDKNKSASLDWPKRFEIIMGVAKGLLYLHEEAPVRIIHRDIKASNILLDDHLNPKISDFGLARLFPNDHTHVTASRISGTYGYMAPEYAMHGYLTVKSDVFSFGVLVLEIVSGRKNQELILNDESSDLLSYIWKLAQEEKALDAVDHSLTNWDSEEVALCIQLGLLCCQAKVKKRPEMGSVLLMLSGDSFTLPKPGKPGILGRQGHWSSTASTNFNSNNNTPNSSSAGATKPSTSSSIEEGHSRNSISVSFTEEGR